jgi:hypothetical protein
MIRLGVMLSVIWLLGFPAYAWFGSMRELEQQYSSYMKHCSAILERDENQTLAYEDCVSEAAEFYQQQFNDYKRHIPQLLAVDFGAVACGWTIPMLGIGIVRFFRRTHAGFR